MARRAFVAAALFVALLCASTGARAQAVDEQSEFDKGRNAYLAHQYDEADARFSKMLDPRTGTLHDRILINQARMYWGAVKIARGHKDEADRLFEELLMSDPSFEPDPLAFPTEVVNTFIDARGLLRERLKAIERDKARREAERKVREEQERRAQVERAKTLERLASEERSVERHSRWTALVPFGVGQFQNGQKTLGWVFLGTEAALVAAAAITVPIYLVDLQYRSDAARQGDNFRYQEYLSRAQTVRTVNLVLNGVFVATALLGIVQAEATFIPEEVVVRTRPLPPLDNKPAPQPSVSLSAAPSTGGFTVGLSGRF